MCKFALDKGKSTLVDGQDAHLLREYSWHASPMGRNWYVVASKTANGKKRTLLLHRLITGAPHGVEVDHINGDGLDNRRCNLRLCNHAENLRNSRRSSANRSGFKGVHWHNASGKWRAQIQCLSVRRHLGLFDSISDAVAAYNAAAFEVHGEFARVNNDKEVCHL